MINTMDPIGGRQGAGLTRISRIGTNQRDAGPDYLEAGSWEPE